MKIVFFETNIWEQGILSKMLEGVNGITPVFFEEKFSSEIISKIKDANVISMFIRSEPITKEIIDLLPNLKLIATRSTGYDHIDVLYAKEKGITVANVPSYGAHTVAEFTFALILALSRKIFPAFHQIREGCNFDISGLKGFDLYGKTLGVIGMGRIGKNVIRIARGFGMNVLGYDIKPDQKFAEETCTKCVSLDEVLAGSDIVTLHTFLSESTRHLMNRKNIFKMKKGSYLINTSRGEVIDTSALVEAITGGHLAGAGLDVLEAERELREEVELLASGENRIRDFKTLYEDHILVDLPQVIVTPHIAFDTKEAEEEILKVTAENIIAYMEGRESNTV